MARKPRIIENNGLDAPETTDPDDPGVLWETRVAALQEERAAYEKRGLTDRVQAVDDELVRLGYRAGAGNVVEDTRNVPVAERSRRRLPKETPSTPADDTTTGR